MTHPDQDNTAFKSGIVAHLTTLLSQGCDALGSAGGDLTDIAEQLRDMVNRPPRVAVVGRLKAGKSTLVNALTQHHIAATGSLECTMAVSLYSDGAPARAEVHGLDGDVSRVPLGDGPLTNLGRPLDEVSHVHQFLPNAQLRSLGLIDTPGTATLTVENEQRTRRMLIDGASDTRRASEWADSVVFLSDSAPREDERAFLSELGMTPLTLVSVLSRADSFGEGAFGERDPLDFAREHSGRIEKELGGAVYRVIPLSGLLAESAFTGRVTNDLARELASLAPLNREQLLDVVELDDPGRIVPGFTAEQRNRLLDTVGEYGVMAGRAAAASGGAVALAGWMREVSGVDTLTRVLVEDVRYYAVLQRAVRVLDELAELSTSHPNREHVRWVQSVTLAQPAINLVMLYRSYRDTFSSTPDSRLLPLLRRAINAASAAASVGLPRDAATPEIRARLDQELGELQQMAMLPLSAAEDEARERLIQEMQRWYRELG